MRSILNVTHYMKDYNEGPDVPIHPPEYDDEPSQEGEDDDFFEEDELF